MYVKRSLGMNVRRSPLAAKSRGFQTDGHTLHPEEMGHPTALDGPSQLLNLRPQHRLLAFIHQPNHSILSRSAEVSA